MRIDVTRFDIEQWVEQGEPGGNFVTKNVNGMTFSVVSALLPLLAEAVVA